MAESKSYELIIIEDIGSFNENNLIEEIPIETALRKSDEEISQNEKSITQNDANIGRDEVAQIKSQPRTKIPISRFRDTVDRVKKDSEAKNNNSLKSFIPKPRIRTGIPVPKSRDVNGPQNNANINTDEDFDKLFKELNDNRDSIMSVDFNVCEASTPADPEVIENYFDDIIHAYDDKDLSGIRRKLIPNDGEIQVASLDFNSINISDAVIDNSTEEPKPISLTLTEENNSHHLTTESILPLDSTVTTIDETLEDIKITDSNNISQNDDSFIEISNEAMITDNGYAGEKYETMSSENNNRHYITTESIVPLDSTITTLDDNVEEILVTDNNLVVTCEDDENNIMGYQDENLIGHIEPIMPLSISKVLRSLSSNNENGVQVEEQSESYEDAATVSVPADAIKHKTVSEKLAMFERKNESSKASRIPKFNKSLTSSLENINKRPIIVDEIPKPQIMKYVNTEETVTVLNDSSIQYKKTAKEFELTEEESEKLRPVIIHEIKMQHSVEENLEVNEVSNTDAEYNEVNNKNNDNTNKIRRYKSLSNMENELERQRKKSLAEIDLGDSIKGRVGNMIQRMISIEAKNNASSAIKKYEMPKKQTVADRIAQFENKNKVTKMISDQIDEESEKKFKKVDPAENGLKIDETKLDDLRTAKETFGSKSVPCIELNNGVNMPVLALGTALLDPTLIPHIIESAIDLGYRAIDTAFIYGNEQIIGEAIKNKINDGTVKREDLFIMSKLWSTFHKPELVEEACKNSLKNLGLEYIDLYMIHNPMSFKEGGDVLPKIAKVLQYSTFDYLDAWRAMEKLVKKGLVKSIGVSNFNSEQLARILDKGRIKPVVNQVESHPYLNQHRLDNFCSARGITLSCFATLGSKDTPTDLKSHQEVVLEDPLIKLMAAAIEKTPAQMLIRYQLDHDRAVVVKSTSAAHLWQNLQALDFKLNNQEMEALDALNKNKRYFTYKGMGDTHKNYPFKLPF